MKRFAEISQEQSKIIELINGMQTIKLSNAERNKRWGWELLQVRLFKISMRTLTLEQYQEFGSSFINQLKNIIVTFLSAKLVVDGDITLGMMLAMLYIVGQLDLPILQLVGFIRELQDAKISLERLSEIHNKPNEEDNKVITINELIGNADLTLNNLTFRYRGDDKLVLNNLTMCIPKNKITAIVGPSGGGKTTLLKLLMKFYELELGEIKLGNHDFKKISPKSWREKCGVVMQDDYIFNDTIANNIALGFDIVDKRRLGYAVDIANISQFIEELPRAYNTIVGMEGHGLSAGQKQRLLIARAVYKNPDYLFFDEATSALDTNTERIITEKFSGFFKNRTVLIIAHRLSTVINADQIVVLDKGTIVEIGNHESLIKKKGDYYNLIKNQLEFSS